MFLSNICVMIMASRVYMQLFVKEYHFCFHISWFHFITYVSLPQ